MMRTDRDNSGPVGRIDVHSHLLPGVDDGCADVAESIACARLMMRAGYTHAFCTPHIWPNFPENNPREIARRVDALQREYDAAGVAMTVMSGGEHNFQHISATISEDELVTYGMRRRYLLADFWAESRPAYLEPAIRRIQSFNIEVIVAHPERIACVQRDPGLLNLFADLGCRLQGNLQCFSDAAGSPTRTTVERFLAEGRYWLLGSDTHGLNTLPKRLDGLLRAIELAGQATVDQLTIENPRELTERC